MEKIQSNWESKPVQEDKRARDELRNLTRKLNQNHEGTLARECKHNPKKFWQYESYRSPGRQSISKLTT